MEILSLLGLIVFSFALRFKAINPPALWYDDLWVGLIAKAHTLNDFLLVKAVSPPLFSVLQLIAIKFVPDKEIAAQFFPVLFSLAQIPLFYFLIKKITNNKWLAFFGAMILAVSARELIVYSTRAKHYSFDSLATVLLLFFYVKFFSKRIDLKYLLLFLLLALVLFLGSFTSVIIAGIFIHILFFRIIYDWHKNYKIKRIFGRAGQLLVILFFDIFAVFLYFKLLKVNIDADVYDYWNNFFINIRQPFFKVLIETAGKLDFFALSPFGSIWEFFINKNFESIFLVLILLALFFGIVYLYKNKRFGILFFICIFYLTAIGLAMVKLYPLSGGRVDIYSYPITILLAVCGVWQIIIFLKFSPFFQRLFFVYLYILLAIFSLFYFTGIQYPYKMNVQNYVDFIEKNLTEKDVVLLPPYTDYAFAYYTNWPITFQKYPTATGFIPIIQKDNVFALPSVGVYSVDAQSIKYNMEYFLSEVGNFEKIYFLSSHCFAEDKKYKNYIYKEYIEKKILDDNFSLIFSTKEEDTCFLKIYQRSDGLE